MILNKLSIKWKMTILSAIVIFLIFMICNVIQLILIQTLTVKQEEEALLKRSEEIRAFLTEQAKLVDGEGHQLVISEEFLDNIVEKNEMIRILDNQGRELYNISDDFPDIRNEDPHDQGFFHTEVHKEDLLVYKEPLTIGSFTGTIEIGRNVETFEDFLKKVIWTLMLGTLLSLVLSLVSGRILAGKLLSPLRVLTNTMRKIEDRQFEERVPVMETKDEFAQLSIIFNSMMDKIEASILQQKKFVEDASHELRTPLAIIHGHLSLLKRWGKNDKEVLESSLNTSINETNRMIGLTNELLRLSQIENRREKRDILRPYNVSETIYEIISNYKLIHAELKIKNENHAQSDNQIAIPEEQLKQLLIVIVDNAIKYSGDHKEITIITRDETDTFKIDIQDNGYGISREDLPYIFDRFYRVDKARSRDQGGSGLGLSIAKEMVEEYKGSISAESILGEGTVIRLTLPYYPS
ncbi:ATP-binding protein [Peribacillus loiseleuriae]|uniref:HAMP domain-containing sensor histidine kinase n=1 Tax=Peribacillus loiseleuriae TaxID=1679170 RepID=UPI0038115DE3